MKIRKIISYLLAIIFVILISATILLSMVNAVVFSKSNLKKQLDKVDYYTQINTIIKEASNNYIMQSGFDESIMDNVVEKEKINEDINNVIDSIYNNEELTISTEQIKTNLNKNIEEYIQKNNYKIARIQAKQTEDNENMSYYYYNERNYTSNFLKSSRYKGYSDYLTNEFFDFLAKYIIGYGEQPFRLLCISVFIISLFALIYMFTGLNTMDYGLVKINLSKNMYTFNEIIIYYLEAWYFSMITFSTVGYGEIIALGIFGKIFVCLEVFLGITIHATWTSVLFSRLIQ